MTTHPLILAAHSAPLTHRVVTAYSDGTTRHHDTRSAATAEMFAIGERRRIGKSFINREDGKARVVVSVAIVAI